MIDTNKRKLILKRRKLENDGEYTDKNQTEDEKENNHGFAQPFSLESAGEEGSLS